MGMMQSSKKSEKSASRSSRTMNVSLSCLMNPCSSNNEEKKKEDNYEVIFPNDLNDEKELESDSGCCSCYACCNSNSNSSDSICVCTGICFVAKEKEKQSKYHKNRIKSNNEISTSRYTIYSYFPKVFMKQYARVANVYYTFIVILLMFGYYDETSIIKTTLTPWGTFFILMIIFAFNFAVEAYDDVFRHRQDHITNTQKCNMLKFSSRKQNEIKNTTKLITVMNHDDPSQSQQQQQQQSQRSQQKQGSSSLLSSSEAKRSSSRNETNRGHRKSTNRSQLQSQSSYVYREKSVSWKDIRVGDIITVSKDSEVPADILLLSINHRGKSQHECFCSTVSIDGESNLKIRSLPNVIRENVQNESDLIRYNFKIDYEPPSKLLSFQGNIEFKDITNETADPIIEPLSIENLLLRGSFLRNTDSVTGIVVYVGHETKVLLAQNKAQIKKSTIEVRMNKIVLEIIALLTVISLISAGVSISPIAISQLTAWYFQFNVAELMQLGKVFVGSFFGFIILYKNILPILIYVCLEITTIFAVYFIQNDIELYFEETDSCAKVRTSSLVQDIGCVDWIFSDKTGTLTRNEMKLVGCAIEGIKYSLSKNVLKHTEKNKEKKPTANGSSSSSSNGDVENQKNDIEEENVDEHVVRNPGGINGFKTKQQLLENNDELMDCCQEADKQNRLFLHCLALCHNIKLDIPDDDDDDDNDNGEEAQEQKIVDNNNENSKNTEVKTEKQNSSTPIDKDEIYRNMSVEEDLKRRCFNAESPDELALVEAACDLGTQFFALENTNVMVIKDRFMDPSSSSSYGNSSSITKLTRYTMLEQIPFNSDRKRMSCIVREENGTYRVICKGADNIMLSLNGISFADHLDQLKIQKIIDEYAGVGLRTLVIATKTIDANFYDDWSKRNRDAALLFGDEKESAMKKLASEIECNLYILAITAIEDKLQDGVADTIFRLRHARIPLWLLTGDKVDTAVSIGYSSRLLDKGSNLIYVGLGNGKSEEDDRENDIKVLNSILNRNERGDWKVESVRDTIDENGQVVKKPPKKNDPKSLALIITGKSLERLLSEERGSIETEKLLIEAALPCSVVIACRVSPNQKAALIRMVKGHVKPEPVTLAIGDGANDIPMIQEARIGVGIAGHEGMGAVNSSDFSFAQFRFLIRLLFYHGRQNYIRVAKMLMLIVYGSIIFTFLSFAVFILLSQGSTSLFTDLLYTVWSVVLVFPAIAIGIFNYDFTADEVMTHPLLYDYGRKNSYMRNSWFHYLRSIVHAIVLAIIVRYALPLYSTFADVSAISYVVLIFAYTARALLIANAYTVSILCATIIEFIFFVGLIPLAFYLQSGNSIIFNNNANLQPWILAFLTLALFTIIEIFFLLIQREIYPKLDVINTEYIPLAKPKVKKE